MSSLTHHVKVDAEPAALNALLSSRRHPKLFFPAGYSWSLVFRLDIITVLGARLSRNAGDFPVLDCSSRKGAVLDSGMIPQNPA